jgi:hypothetical protein
MQARWPDPIACEPPRLLHVCLLLTEARCHGPTARESSHPVACIPLLISALLNDPTARKHFPPLTYGCLITLACGPIRQIVSPHAQLSLVSF